ncbi:hypothetical protein CB0940_07668 [Cercospora beticola]|uniref:NTF2-like domain-containing protein n=1 Tax=Cercospora beticola TaxID=122368 RepID=A0A2G5H7C0_CERBT|nr:hypothetical protein CB0940_07668 [Cercospora beticola]PIA88435.1 hypothetical protein CB0940_07668 [Cercospora beticola]WPB03634.1 hypothetical protein RHO25_008274 [Cercospora beticola]CAK1357619.1 unnamed protein product [Cercospora beticola]
MQLLSVLVVIPFVYGYTTTPTATEPCLSEPEAANIARRWFSIFQTDSQGNGTGAALVDVTLAPEFEYTDEGATFGDPTPLYTNRSAVYDSVSSSGYSGALVTDVQYDVLYVFSSCSVIGTRWQGNSKSAEADNVTVPVGTTIRYLGTDYLQVDLATRLIYNATSSSDLLNYYKQLGDSGVLAG